jgi:ubiquinone/menaquinone biosynthesis C-methylase UbiE
MKKDYADYLLKYSQKVYDNIAFEFSKTRHGFWSDLNFLIDYVKKGQKVLDLGCGNGRLLNVLRDKDICYVGVDNSEKILLEAQKQYPEYKDKFWKADALNLPFIDDEFDIIFSIAVLQHIPSKEYRLKFLKECLRTLKKDGKIILTVWLVKTGSSYYYSIYNIINKIKSIFGISKIDFNDLIIPFKVDGKNNLGDRYVHAFSLKEFRNIFKSVGFKIEESGYTKDKKGKKRNLYIVASKS